MAAEEDLLVSVRCVRKSSDMRERLPARKYTSIVQTPSRALIRLFIIVVIGMLCCSLAAADEENMNCTSFCDDYCEVSSTTGDEEVVRLKFLTHPWWSSWIASTAANFESERAGAIQLEFVTVDFDQLIPDVINEAASQTGLYDGFITPPTVAGSVVELKGWADLTPYIHETAGRAADWADILLAYRQMVAQYRQQIILYPLDGDLLHLFFRKDVLEHFNLTVPRTWDEYNQVAAATHGKVYENQTLVGSCVGRILNCAGSYWANLLISSMTQTEGAWSGHLLDTADLKPLTGPVLEQALLWMEEQVRYGPDEEFDFCFELNVNSMREGKCVLTYNWGDSFKGYLQGETTLRGRYGVASTPGSKQVLDRSTMELVDCDEGRCPHGKYHSDLGWLNHAPYAAFGGWACAVNNYTDPKKKRLATEFCAFAASKDESIKEVIPNATVISENGQDPFRRSHLNVEDYVAQGYERETATDYIEAIVAGLGSVNVVTDIRFPTASDLNRILDREFHDYLYATKNGLIPESARPARRKELSERITRQWLDTMKKYDSQGSTQVPILEMYQKLRGVYAEEYDLNQINKVRGYGYALVSIILFTSILFAAWTIRYRKSNIVRASQPFFLVIICFGTSVFGSSIFVFGIDDSDHSAETCTKACRAMPWLLAMGWSIIFSALFAKIWRVNIVYRHARQFKRLKVSERVVLLPFVVIFTINLTLLLVWTLVDPLVWTRTETSKTESYGSCRADSNSNTWKILVSLLGVVNGTALIMANFQAYQARHVAVEYGESKYIALAMASILQVVIVGLPLLFLVEENPSAKYFIWCTIIFIICMSILLLIFVPKIMIWWKKNDERVRILPRGPSEARGLSFKVVNRNPLKAGESDIKLITYKAKVAHLNQIMQDKGIDADTLFREAGLFEGEPQSSHVVSTRPPGSSAEISGLSSGIDCRPLSSGVENSLTQLPEENDGDVADENEVDVDDDGKLESEAAPKETEAELAAEP